MHLLCPVDGERQRQSGEEEESGDGSAQEGEDHGPDVRDAETFHQREQRTFPTKSGGAGGFNICCCRGQVHLCSSVLTCT